MNAQYNFNGTLVVIEYKNEKRDAFNRALVLNRLAKIYDCTVSDELIKSLGQMATQIEDERSIRERIQLLAVVRMSTDPAFAAQMEIREKIEEFASLFVRVSKILWAADNGDISSYVISNLTTRTDEMFQNYLENAEFWGKISEAVNRIDFPNGKEGAREEDLTEAEKKDPFLSKNVKPIKAHL